MKKVHEIIKPFLSIIFGALLFLVYLNFLSFSGVNLAIGIIAVILSAFYLINGILGVVIGDKIGNAKKYLDVTSIIGYPLFLFVVTLLGVINAANNMGPTAWVIAIISLIGTISLAVIYLLKSFISNKVIARMSYLLSSIFVLVLLLNVLFAGGAPIDLGDINIVGTVIYALYAAMLLDAVFASNKEEIAVKEKSPNKEESSEEVKAEEKVDGAEENQTEDKIEEDIPEENKEEKTEDNPYKSSI